MPHKNNSGKNMTYKTICYAMCGTALMSSVSISNFGYGIHLNTAFADDTPKAHVHKKSTHHKKHHEHKKTSSKKAVQDQDDSSDSQDDDKDSDSLKNDIKNTDKKFNPAITTSDPLVHGIPKGWNADVIGVGPKDNTDKQDNKSKESNTVVIDTTKTGLPNDQSAPKILIPPTSKNRILIPLSPNMGIAGYQSGEKFIIVVDNKEPLDISALHGDGIFSNLSLTTLPGFTMMTLPIPDTRKLYMSKQSNGWVLGDQMPPGVDYSDRAEINPSVDDGKILFPMRRAGRILTINDPVTNTPLIIGTTILDDGGMLSARKDAEYDIWPSIEGIVVAKHDKNSNIELISTNEGDLLKKIDGTPLNDLSRATYASVVDLEWLGLKNLSPQKAQERYKQALLDAADSSPKDKFNKRIEAAKAAIGASDFKNALAIINTALDDDPEESKRPDITFLFSVISFLNHDYKNSESLMQEWPEEDIRATKLWKGIYMSQTGEDNDESSKLIARDYGRLLNYPDAIKDVLLPMASEQIARFGTPDQKKELSKMPNNRPEYAFDKALIELGNGNKDKAVYIFEDLSGSTDLPVMEKSLEAGISMSLNDNNITPEQAEQQYASLLPDATLVDREGPLNLLRAKADIKSNNFSKALSALDAASQTHLEHKNPEVKLLYNKALHEVSNQISANNQNNTLSQEDIIHDAALIESHINDMPDSPQKVEMLVAYGEALDKLGLAENATDNFQKAFNISNEPMQKAKVADKLANNLIKRKLYDESEKAINDSSSNLLTPEENVNRSRILARISAGNGKPEVALMLLNAYSDPDSSYIKAVIHENRQEWSDAVKDLKIVVQNKITKDGVLNNEQQILALKIASDASRANDASTLAWIKDLIGNRTFNGSDGQIFQLLVNGGSSQDSSNN